MSTVTIRFKRVSYGDLNARQQENYNFQKVSAVLADYGYTTIRLSSDWGSADFIAQHLDGHSLPVQLKGRWIARKDYKGKGLFICFPDGDDWYIYPHDEVFDALRRKHGRSKAWKQGIYHSKRPSRELRNFLQKRKYRLPANKAKGERLPK